MVGQYLYELMSEKSEYKSLSEWRKYNLKDYQFAYRHGWLNNICDKFGWERKDTKKKPNGYWTKERCVAEAKKYKTTVMWSKNNLTSYSVARKNGWLDECTKHMIELKKPNGYWTKERCVAEAKKYKTLKDWDKNNPTSLGSARKNGWYNECIKHMTFNQKPNGYWTKERIIEDCKKYKNQQEWRTNNGSTYTKACKNGWVNECSKHMNNLVKPSGYWTKERCIAEAKKYKSRSEWAGKTDGIGSPTSYGIAKKNRWFDECTKHMNYLVKPPGYWTKENCLIEAKKYKSRSVFSDKCSAAYTIICKNGWVNEAFGHMDILQTPHNYWTKEKCVDTAKKFTKNKDWCTNYNGAYHAARRNGWLDECRKHMDETTVSVGHWNIKKNVINSAKLYKNTTVSQWQKKYGGAVKSARRNGWMDECKIIILGK